MGGYGSGYYRPKKDLVENHVALDVRAFSRNCPLRPGLNVSGGLRWSRGELETASVGFVIHCDAEEPHLALQYRINDKHDVQVTIGLTRTSLISGGAMWWFLCPDCQSRRRKLYLVRGYFTCRVCADLVYESSQTARRFNSLYKHVARDLGVGVDEIKSALAPGLGRETGRRP